MHRAVLTNEALEFLRPAQNQQLLDATIGCGGHAQELLKKITPGGRLIGIDCDEKALAIAGKRLNDFKGAFELIHDDFRNLDKVLDKLGIKEIDGALFDLGVSSLQLDDAGRGFSFRHKARLDMRMDGTVKLSAYELINNAGEAELNQILKNYGEERFHRRIAKAIIEYRQRQPIAETTELAQIIYEAVPTHYRKYKIDPATRTFQALRIAVNDELTALKQALTKITGYLKPGARLAVISFHSLEDRIVKHHFRAMAKNNVYSILTKKPLVAGEPEIEENPRARSAKLRAVEKNA